MCSHFSYALLIGTEKFIDNLINLMSSDASFLLAAVSIFFEFLLLVSLFQGFFTFFVIMGDILIMIGLHVIISLCRPDNYSIITW